MKDYLSEMIDLTEDGYLNPFWPGHIRNVGSITSISIHHDAAIRLHDYDSVERYRNEAADHYESLGPGLMYHYKIDNVGQIFKIRPHDTWLHCVGTDENVSTLAICLDGYFHPPYNQKPTKEQYEALGQLLINLCEKHPEFPATYPDVRPHRDFSPTACPGDLLAPWVFAIHNKTDVLRVPEDASYDWPSYQAVPAEIPQVAPTVLPIQPSPIDPKPVEVPATKNPSLDHELQDIKKRVGVLEGLTEMILGYLRKWKRFRDFENKQKDKKK